MTRNTKEKCRRLVPRVWVCRAMLVAVIVITFSPVLSSDFIKWDDTDYVVDNALLRNASGLREMWNPFAGKLQQYYPLVFTSYWVEYHLWQLNPAAYHATNVVLHAINALLVLELLQALGASLGVAAVAAAVFAVHPVQVESVAWVTERKNMLSGFFYLTAFLLYLRHRRTGSWSAYIGVLFAFAAALLSKSQTVTLPVMLFLTDWLLQQTGRLRSLRPALVATRLAPMVALALAMAMATTVVERQVALVVQLPTLGQRLLVATNAPWFYAATFVAPFRLAPIYPKWNVVPCNPLWWMGAVAWAALVPLAYRHGARLGVLPLWGVAQFFITLSPVLGLVPFNYQDYSYVADRFLYLSCIGGGVAVVAFAERVARGRPASRRWLGVLAAFVVLTGSVLSYRQALHWRSNVSFWTYAFARNPESYPPNLKLGAHYAAAGQWPEALRFYQKAHELEPELKVALRLYLEALGTVRGPHAVIEACSTTIQQRSPNVYVAHLYRARSYEALGRRAEALADYDRVLALAPPGSTPWQQARQGRARCDSVQLPVTR